MNDRIVGVLKPESTAYADNTGSVNPTAIWVGVIYNVILVRYLTGRHLIPDFVTVKKIKASSPK